MRAMKTILSRLLHLTTGERANPYGEKKISLDRPTRDLLVENVRIPTMLDQVGFEPIKSSDLSPPYAWRAFCYEMLPDENGQLVEVTSSIMILTKAESYACEVIEKNKQTIENEFLKMKRPGNAYWSPIVVDNGETIGWKVTQSGTTNRSLCPAETQYEIIICTPSEPEAQDLLDLYCDLLREKLSSKILAN